MGIQTLLGKLRRREQDAGEKTIEQFDELVTALADDREVNEDTAANVLAESGKTPDDLDQAVRQLVEQRELAKLAAKLGERKRQRAEAQKALAAAEKKAEDDTKAIEQHLVDMRGKVTQAEQGVSESAFAQSALEQRKGQLERELEALTEAGDPTDAATHRRATELKAEVARIDAALAGEL